MEIVIIFVMTQMLWSFTAIAPFDLVHRLRSVVTRLLDGSLVMLLAAVPAELQNISNYTFNNKQGA